VRLFGGTAAAALALLVCAATATAANVLPNGSFETDLSGWSSSTATLAQATDGVVGAKAMSVVRAGSNTTYTVTAVPRSVASATAGATYTATAWIRSATPGKSVCLRVREWRSGSVVGYSTGCTTATSTWKQLPPVTIVVAASGDALDLFAYQGSAVSGDSFELDGVSLDDGTTGGGTADTTPPETMITSGPPASTTATTAQFAFSSSEPSSTFRCALDGAAFAACSSPATYTVGAGSHTYSDVAVDAAGNVDPTPATQSWTVTVPDTTPPDTSITAGPASSTTSTSAQFSFASSESGSTFRCTLDGGAPAACTSPASYSGLATGSHTFTVAATDAAGNVDPTPAAQSWTVQAGSTQADPTLVLVGDQHACDGPGLSAVATLIGSLDKSWPIVSLGDASGDTGTLTEYQSCLDPFWGSLKPRVHPALGNHDWRTGNANGYFGYWGAAAGPVNQGWYSFDVGTWHVIVLSSYCGKVGGCSAATPQGKWLAADLAAHTNRCTLAVWHHPYYTSFVQPDYSGGQSGIQGFWKPLYQAGADVVVNAHSHDYERFAPQDPYGAADPQRGIRQFIVGTGGGELHTNYVQVANEEAVNDATWGVLELTLHASSYDWKFVPVAGSSYTDSGTGSCH
jgi:hypothetical protein